MTQAPIQPTDSSTAIATLKGSAIQLLNRVMQRGLGIASMLVLARLLAPEDFGIVATCTLITFFLDAIVNVGARQYIITLKEVDADHLNTAWTINLIVKLLMFTILVAVSAPISQFLDKPEVRLPICVLAIVFPLGALGNPGMLLFIRDLNYRPSFLIEIQSKVIAAAVTISLALTTRSYWALISGTIVSYALPAILSYYFSEFRPKVSLLGARRQLSFSKWMLLSSCVGFARAEADTIVATKVFSLESLGIYSMFRNLSSILSVQVIQPALDPLLSTFSKAHRSGGLRAYQVNATLLIASTALLPVSSWLLLFSSDVVLIVLGSQWIEHAETLGILSTGLFPGVLQTVLGNILLAKGAVAVVSRINLFTAVVSIGLFAMLSEKQMEPEAYALLQVQLTVLSVLVLMLICHRGYHPFALADVAIVTSPLLASIFGFITVRSLTGISISELGELGGFVASSVVFAVVVFCSYAIIGFITRRNEAVQLIARTALESLSQMRGYIKRLAL